MPGLCLYQIILFRYQNLATENEIRQLSRKYHVHLQLVDCCKIKLISLCVINQKSHYTIKVNGRDPQLIEVMVHVIYKISPQSVRYFSFSVE